MSPKKMVLLASLLLVLFSGCAPAGYLVIPQAPVQAGARPTSAPADSVATPTRQAPAPAMNAAAYDSRVPRAWFGLQLYLVQATPGFTPPVAARAFGYSGVALYEALVPGMPGYQSLVGQLNEFTSVPPPAEGQTYNWPAVASSTLAEITRRLYANASPESEAAIAALEEHFAASFRSELAPDLLERSLARGRAVAEAIFAWSTTDGGYEGYMHNFPQDFTVPSGPGMWVSTPPNFDLALQPYWGDNRPFVLASGAECSPGPPPSYSENPDSDFYQEALEVYQSVNNLTPEQYVIARFWADDPGKTQTPPGHSLSILTQVLEHEGASLDVAAEAYAKLGMAVADAFIGCWNTKYVYNLIRPITYIQRVIDPTWNTPQVTDPVITPPFPEYTSGHSAQSGAAAQVLTDLFGENYSFIDHTHDGRGLAPRSFDSFAAFADEAAISRLYGGIHYRAAIELGLEQGRCIGRQVSALQFKTGSG